MNVFLTFNFNMCFKTADYLKRLFEYPQHMFCIGNEKTPVMPAKSDSDALLCLQLLTITLHLS